MYEELQRVNRSLSVKVYQLHNLFDIGRELTASLDEEAIERLVITTVMGHFLASRCGALPRSAPKGSTSAHARGLRPGEAPARHARRRAALLPRASGAAAGSATCRRARCGRRSRRRALRASWCRSRRGTG